MKFFQSPLSQKILYAVLAGLASTMIFSSPLFALDPKKRITQYDIRVYKAEDGLPMNDMKSVFQDSKGYIWLGCQEGFVRFDGARFVLFDKSNCPGLRENFIWDIEEDWEGNLWLATNGGGVSRFDGKSCTTFDTSNGLASNIVKRILIGRDRTIWFGTENGVTRLKNGVYSSYKFGDLAGSQEIFALHEDRWGNLLVGIRQPGLHVIRNDSTFTLPTDSYIYSFGEHVSGEIILGSSNGTNGTLYVYHHNHVEKFDPYQLPTSHCIRAIHEDQQGNLWFATEGDGVLRYSEGRFEVLKMETGLEADNNFFNQVIEDREGNLWFASGSGLFQLRDNKFIAFGRNEGFVSNFGHTVCEDHDSNMWAGLRYGGLAMFDQFNIRTRGVEDGLASDVLTAVFPAKDGGLWIGTTNGLNYLKDGHIRDHWKEWNGHIRILSLFENMTGKLWIGMMYGFLSKFDGKRFVKYRLAAEGESGDVIAVIETANGEVWAGTRKQGLYKLTGDSISHFTETDGIAADGVNALYEDAEHVLWIATDGQGLYRYKDGKFTQFTSRNGLYFDRLFSILEDDQHNLWFSGNRGIFQTSKQQLNDFAEGKAGTIICQAYNDLDGMRETECNGRRQPVAWKSRDGRLWFVSTAGVVCVDPNNMPINEVSPPVYIEEITANQQRKISPDSAAIPLEAHERELAIRYTALSYAIPERVYFKYMLEGYDQDWIDAGTRRTAFYTNLAKGHYTFRVKACNNEGKWNDIGATIQFSIAPFWWETWWAYSLYALAFGLLLYGLRRYEMKRVHLRNELKLEHVRSERLQELDHLKSRFFAGISHEFRTPLTLIGGPLEEILAETHEAQKRPRIDMMLRNTRRLERLVEQLLDLAQLESGKMALQARPVKLIPFLQGLLASFESYAHRKNINLEFHTNDRLAAEIIFIDPDKMEKIIANLLFNALKYTPSGGSVEVTVGTEKKVKGEEREAKGEERGEKGDGRPSHFVLRPSPFSLHPSPIALHNYVEISIKDTGAGIPEKALSHIFDYFYRYRNENTRRESGTGIGLALTKELVTLHHGEISVTSQEGVGSEFVIRLPLGKAHLKPEEIASEQLSVSSDQFSLNSTQSLITGDDDPAHQQSTDPTIQPSSDQQPVILLIEDNPDMRRYLREHLNHTNRLLEATNGEEGLQKAVEEIPDLIISDVMMPKMDGFELCRQLKTGELTSHIPIILLTARGSGESKIAGLELGADDYLTKPVSGRELQLRVKNWMERQHKQRERFRREMAALDMQLPSIPIASADKKFLRRAKEVLEKHLTDPDFSSEAFAQEMAMSRAHLNRKLRGLLGQRTSEFIRTMRLKRAAELLRQKSGSVSEIAYQVGFNHLSYFARCFKEQYGQLPHEYSQQ